MESSKTQIAKLGKRLSSGRNSEDDLFRLDAYRRSFGPAYEVVIRALSGELGLSPTGRQIKTTQSIVAKLAREKTSLPRMQDIAGCRIVVETCAEQDDAVRRICFTFKDSKAVDRRKRPSHGYRAVHVVIPVEGKLIEVQVRTSLQHGWAELSEKLADIVGAEIKYGEGPKVIQDMLMKASRDIAETEALEEELSSLDRDDESYENMAGRVETLKSDWRDTISLTLESLDALRKLP
jgi:ppGpp synthetase/RelA/SpoT-type nucleotidyltranferase